MKKIFSFFFLLPSLLYAQLNNEIYENRQLDFIKSEHSTNYQYLVIFSCYCDGCIAGMNKETFFFVYNDNGKSIFKRIGLYSDSKIINYSDSGIIEFFLSNDYLLQKEEIDDSFVLMHKGRMYSIKVYHQGKLVYERKIAKYNLNKNSDTALVKFIQILKEEIFDISVLHQFEYKPCVARNAPCTKRGKIKKKEIEYLD